MKQWWVKLRSSTKGVPFTAVTAVVALLLSAASFYFNFLRQPFELRIAAATIDLIAWDAATILPIAVMNTGTQPALLIDYNLFFGEEDDIRAVPYRGAPTTHLIRPGEVSLIQLPIGMGDSEVDSAFEGKDKDLIVHLVALTEQRQDTFRAVVATFSKKTFQSTIHPQTRTITWKLR